MNEAEINWILGGYIPGITVEEIVEEYGSLGAYFREASVYPTAFIEPNHGMDLYRELVGWCMSEDCVQLLRFLILRDGYLDQQWEEILDELWKPQNFVKLMTPEEWDAAKELKAKGEPLTLYSEIPMYDSGNPDNERNRDYRPFVWRTEFLPGAQFEIQVQKLNFPFLLIYDEEKRPVLIMRPEDIYPVYRTFTDRQKIIYDK